MVGRCWLPWNLSGRPNWLPRIANQPGIDPDFLSSGCIQGKKGLRPGKTAHIRSKANIGRILSIMSFFFFFFFFLIVYTVVVTFFLCTVLVDRTGGRRSRTVLLGGNIGQDEDGTGEVA